MDIYVDKEVKVLVHDDFRVLESDYNRFKTEFDEVMECGLERPADKYLPKHYSELQTELELQF